MSGTMHSWSWSHSALVDATTGDKTITPCDPFRVGGQQMGSVSPGALRDPGLMAGNPSGSGGKRGIT